jgi:hypothetical protein
MKTFEKKAFYKYKKFLRHTNSFEIYNDGVQFNEFVPSINPPKAGAA